MSFRVVCHCVEGLTFFTYQCTCYALISVLKGVGFISSSPGSGEGTTVPVEERGWDKANLPVFGRRKVFTTLL